MGSSDPHSSRTNDKGRTSVEAIAVRAGRPRQALSSPHRPGSARPAAGGRRSGLNQSEQGPNKLSGTTGGTRPRFARGPTHLRRRTPITEAEVERIRPSVPRYAPPPNRLNPRVTDLLSDLISPPLARVDLISRSSPNQ